MSFIIDEYINSDSIIILNYDDMNPKMALHSVSVFSGNLLTTTILDPEIFPPVTLSKALEYANKSQNSVRTTTFSSSKDSIYITTNFQVTAQDYIERISLAANGKSLDWWFVFKWKAYSEPLLYYYGKWF